MPQHVTTHSAIPADSVAADTIVVDSNAVLLTPHYADAFPGADSIASDSITSHSTAFSSITTLPVMTLPSQEKGKPFAASPLHDTNCMALVLVGLTLILVSYRTGYKYLENLMHNMFSIRRRENLFEDHTLNETKILTALTINTCIMEGLLTYMALFLWIPHLQVSLQNNIFLHVGIFSAVALIFYIAQLLAYNLIGHVFSDGLNTKLWTDGFKATNALLGLLLFPVTALLLVSPNLTKVLLICAISLYFCTRIVFICKGFRIFYSNLPSLIYFILYLCAVEIVPIAILTAGIVSLCNLLQQ